MYNFNMDDFNMDDFKRMEIISISCGICKMDCENCKTQQLIDEHNHNVEKQNHDRTVMQN